MGGNVNFSSTPPLSSFPFLNIFKIASLAGTDILPPLRDILQQGPNPDYPRQLFCLTDGEVTNTNEVLEFIRKSGSGTRIFTFGIGADASPTVRGFIFFLLSKY